MREELHFEKHQPYQPRSFLAPDADLSDIEEIRRYFKGFMLRTVESSEELEKLILDQSELMSALEQKQTILQYQMIRNTADKKARTKYATFTDEILPKTKELNHHFYEKYLLDRQRVGTGDDNFEIFEQRIRSDTELFKEENISLEVQDEGLRQEYQRISGGISVEYSGDQYTAAQIQKFMSDSDRCIREDAWRARSGAWQIHEDRLETIFSEMVSLRQKIACNAGYENFLDYQFKALHRFDYTVADAQELHAAIQEWIVPLVQAIHRRRTDRLDVSSLRPWDLDAAPPTQASLNPFENVSEFLDGGMSVFKSIHEDFGAQLAELAETGLLDLSSHLGKAPGAFSFTLNEVRKPLIFMNATGADRDIRSLFHEGGHSFHTLACAHQPLHIYRYPPLEFAEVASFSMELMASEHLDPFYSEKDRQRSRIGLIEGLVETIPWVTTGDAFQHWVYSHPNHTRSERGDAWIDIHNCLQGGVDWSGLDQEHQAQWYPILHFFQLPLYTVEYVIALIGAFRHWHNYKKDPVASVEAYRDALALGGSRPLPELFSTAGLNFDFSTETVKAVAGDLRLALEELWDESDAG